MDRTAATSILWRHSSLSDTEILLQQSTAGIAHEVQDFISSAPV